MKTSGGFYFYGMRIVDQNDEYIMNREWDKNLGEWSTPVKIPDDNEIIGLKWFYNGTRIYRLGF